MPLEVFLGRPELLFFRGEDFSISQRQDVGGFDHGVTFGCQHPDAAQGAAVIVEVDNGPAEALVTNSLNLRRSLSKARRAFLDAANDIHSVGACGQISKRLFFQERLDLR